MKKILLFAMLIIATMASFATEKQEPLTLKKQVVEAAIAAPTNEVVTSIDYLVTKYSANVVNSEVTKTITKEAVEKQVIQGRNSIWTFSILILLLLGVGLLLILPYKFWRKRNSEEGASILGIIILGINLLIIIIFMCSLPNLIAQISTPTYHAFKEIAEILF